MKRGRQLATVSVALLLAATAAALTIARPPALLAQAGRGGASTRAAETFHFVDVTLSDGGGTYEHAEIYVRVKSTGGGYTRADYMDRNGRRLGFYEAFEVVSTEEAALRAWAIRNFSDRTIG
jgi:hypothetical protein